MDFDEIGLSGLWGRYVEDAAGFVEGEAGGGESVGAGLTGRCSVLLKRRLLGKMILAVKETECTYLGGRGLLISFGEGATENSGASKGQLADDAMGHGAPGIARVEKAKDVRCCRDRQKRQWNEDEAAAAPKDLERSTYLVRAVQTTSLFTFTHATTTSSSHKHVLASSVNMSYHPSSRSAIALQGDRSNPCVDWTSAVQPCPNSILVWQAQ